MKDSELQRQLAEKQRRLDIEDSLEKVRARTMAMHHSTELGEVVQTLNLQFENLRSDTVASWLGLIDADANTITLWVTNKGILRSFHNTVNGRDFPSFQNDIDSFRSGIPYWQFQLEKSVTIPVIKQNFDIELDWPDGITHYQLANLRHEYGILGFGSWEKADEEALEILGRFAKVFEQAYTRFLDLQKAEAQAREAEIELGLERVRARSMAMHRTEELQEAAEALNNELSQLGLKNINQCGYAIYHEQENIQVLWLTRPGGASREKFTLPVKGETILNERYHAWKRQEPLYYRKVTKKQFDDHRKLVFRQLGSKVAEEVSRNEMPDSPHFYCANFREGYLHIVADDFFDKAQVDIIIRFTRVFSQTYTRFLDLQKAEAQAREAEIQLALERVRARTMAMQSSGELAEVVQVVYEQFNSLKIANWGANIMLMHPKEPSLEIWLSENERKVFPHPFFLRGTDILFIREQWDGWYSDKQQFTLHLHGDKKKEYDDETFTKHDFKLLPETVKAGIRKLKEAYFTFSKMRYGFVVAISAEEKISEEGMKVLDRFASVFEQTYTRFLDLRKAEAQAREAQIESALEKVRSRSLAMHKSDELAEIVSLVFEKLRDLNVTMDAASIMTFKEGDKGHTIWAANPDLFTVYSVYIPFFEHPMHKTINEGREQGGKFIDQAWSLEEKNALWKLRFENADYSFLADEIKQAVFEFEGWGLTGEVFKNSATFLVSYSQKSYSDNEKDIIRRIGKVFEQAYIRFIDLQRAEAQAREAQIEAALERVRSRAMAMQKSDELSEAAEVLYGEFSKLGVKAFASGYLLNDDQKAEWEIWATNPGAETFWEVWRVPYYADENLKARYDSWKSGEKFHRAILEGDANRKHHEMIAKYAHWKEVMLDFLPQKLVFNSAHFSLGHLLLISEEKLTSELEQALVRFAGAFDLAYRRFLDLKKAEAQAREAEIEVALERIRARSMAMQSSNELSDVVKVMYEQVNKLDIAKRGCTLLIFDKEKNCIESWFSDSVQALHPKPLYIHDRQHRIIQQFWNFWEGEEEMMGIYLDGEEKTTYGEYLLSQTDYHTLSPEVKTLMMSEPEVYFEMVNMEYGILHFISTEHFSKESIPVLKRIANTFNQAYTRFKDIQTAEAAARETLKQTALDRIRADIASMRTKDDLDRITPLIWNELTVLGVPFIRCGVFIMDEQQRLIHTFLSTPEGKAIAAFHLPFDTPGKIQNVLSHWHQGDAYIDHWDEEEFTQFADILANQGALDSAENYMETIPAGGFHLHFLPFLQGMLYVGNSTKLDEEAIELLQSVADAFSTAYARYEDFNKMEAAKKEVDSALTKLQATQRQLIQSEKMASLGELTAGIAHEIQNPLNFVNNFSEVNRELIEELKSENEKLKNEEIGELLENIAANEEKINFHGKRADSIVKNMLQHSRQTSGVKQPTNINGLCDEYLRLAYHGMRAKDKSFNAEIKTDFDERVVQVNVVAQEIGRVLLNLFNNAFYAVHEKSTKTKIQAFKPVVGISTRRIDDGVEIVVSDNGSGMPEAVKEKIFQPFFTTKPTGQGTGLGLSLVYDIVKSHGGEIKVKSTEGEGTEFVILLPV